MNTQLTDRPPYARADVLGLMLEELRSATVPMPSISASAAPVTTAGSALLPPTAPTVPVGTALRHRRAIRFYADAPLGQGDLHAVLAAAGTKPGGSLSVIVAARRVEGLTPAVYRYHPGAGRLEELAELTGSPAQLEGCVLQREFAAAPAIVIVTGRLGEQAVAAGAKGYARLMTEGGQATANAWTAAARRGLVGSTFAGLLQASLRDMAGIDGYSEMGVLGLAVGLPLTDDTPSRP
ncbi:hypothetical protein ACZ90_67200 [Streptomyces albus subsp. albus]|nr:hypothetical protein ACZ90_67200 [Streptomyces albus subsp. albus]